MRLLFRTQNVDTSGFESEKAARARVKGDLVDILDDGVFAGKKSEPSSPEWEGIHCIVNVSDITKEEARAYTKRWFPKVDYEILASDAQGFRIKAWVVNPGVSGLGNLTKDKIEHLIINYGGAVVSFAANEVIFDIPNETADELKDYVRDYVQSQTIKRSQFYIDESEVDYILSQGGEVTITKAQLLTRIKNKLDD